MKQLDLSIIILNYNTEDWVQNVLNSITAFSPKITYEIIVVDNGSTDQSVSMIKKEFPKVMVLDLGENGGFAVGNNAGIVHAQGRYIMLLNSDTEFTAETQLEKAIRYLDNHPKIAVLTPKLLLASGELDLASHRGEPTPWAAVTYLLGFEKLFPNTPSVSQYHQLWKNFDEPHAIDACSGAAMIVKKEVINQVGLLDEQFFMYAEDLDWCKRIREAGYAIFYFPESVVVHHKYKSGFEKEAQQPIIDPQNFLDIPGFSKKHTRNTTTKFHFYNTMKQYYTKHYGHKNSMQVKMMHSLIDLVSKIKRK